jgi:predicted HTH transcriptional regulator
MTHPNSIAAHVAEKSTGALSKRASLILTAARQSGPFTDRQMQHRLRLPDPNSVRPRITELVMSGLLEECGSTRDALTGKTVRVCRVPVRGQLEMFPT